MLSKGKKRYHTVVSDYSGWTWTLARRSASLDDQLDMWEDYEKIGLLVSILFGDWW